MTALNIPAPDAQAAGRRTERQWGGTRRRLPLRRISLWRLTLPGLPLRHIHLWRRSLRGDAGSISLELVIVAPALLLLASGIIAAGRLAQAHQAVQLAASQAARATALAASPGAGVSVGRSQAGSAVAALGQPCQRLVTDVAAGGLTHAPGAASTVSVTVSCDVAMSDLLIPGFPGAIRIVESASEPVDRWLTR